MNASAEPSPPLTPDDPRLSEWIDGRLPPAEAAAVERAVSRSPELARLVADLRGMKAAARQVTAASPPAGFADRVMAAVVADRAAHGGAASDSSDRLVEAEWRAIEAERIAEERAEAAADLEEEIGPVRTAKRPTWPWLTIATALAAGLLVTVVLNRPRPERDAVEVAVVTDREAEPLAKNGALRNRNKEALREAAKDQIAAAQAPAAAVAPRELARADEQRKSRAEADMVAEPIEVMVRGPQGRAKLLAHLASLGLTAMPSRAEVLELVGPEEAVAAFLADPLGDQPSLAAPPSAKGLPVPGEAALLASEARDGEAKPARSDRRPGGNRSAVGGLVAEGTSGELARATPAPTAGLPEEALAADKPASLRARGAAAAPPVAADLAAAPPPRRILVRVVELPVAAGEPSEP